MIKKFSIIVSSFSVVTLIYFYYVKKCYNYLKSLGYDGPKPKFLLGNILEFVSEKNSIKNSRSFSHYSKTLQRWTKTYGKIYGYYEGHSPVLVLADPDLITEVFLNQNKLYTYRRSFPMSKKSSDPNSDIFINNGMRWLRVRYALEKIMLNTKNTAKCLEYADNSFINTFRLQNDLNKPQLKFNIFNQTKLFMIQTIFTVIFGNEINLFLQKKPHIHTVFNQRDLEDSNLAKSNNLYFTKMVSHKFDVAFESFESFSLLKLLSLTIPELSHVWRLCENFKFFFNSYFFHMSYFADPMFWFYSNFIQKNLIIYTQEQNEEEISAGQEDSYLNFKNNNNKISTTRLASQSQNLGKFITRKQFCYFNSFLFLTYMPIIKYNQSDTVKKRINSVSDSMRTKKARLPSLSTINELKKQRNISSYNKKLEENNFTNSRNRMYSIDRLDNKVDLKPKFITNDLETEDFENWKLTVNEALSNTLLMFFAGYETTSTAITFCCKVISSLPEQREKLLDEIKDNWHSLKFNLEKYKIKAIKSKIDSTSFNSDDDDETLCNESDDYDENDDVFDDDVKVDNINNDKDKSRVLDEWNELYESLENMKYLDIFVKEVLRMFPIANSMVSRKCVVDNLYIDNGIYKIPNGMNIVVDVLSIHYDALWWGPVDPNIFYPERFLTERHPAAWLAFGIGSRKCLGVKLAMSQIKLFIVRLLQNYVIDKPKMQDDDDDDDDDLNEVNRNNFSELIETKDVFFTAPVDPVYVSISPRKI
ncbi:unnamed protein product [Brachionus calyciflorus]|uniref:Cytochrome p450 n=1 Tax=Brachionus calyciflorus TaxID=104777 RepID=A0A813M7N5_9BILA|nr:unnamed protein product [Brachionus calyciflorus]